MSAIASAWALEVETGSPTNKLVLLVLADRHNKDTGKCCPSVALLTKDTELGQTAVKKALRELEKAGLITKERRQRSNGSDMSSQFVLHMGGLLATPPPSPGDPLEPELEPEVEQDLTPSPSTPSKQERDAVWDALEREFGGQTTPRGRKRLGALRRELLLDSSLTPGGVVDEIPVRAQRYRDVYPGMALTFEAFAKHWPDLREGGVSPKPNMKYGRRDVSARELLDLADRIKSEREGEVKQLASG